MLNEKQKDSLRQIKIYNYTIRENKNEDPIDGRKKIIVPSWSSLHLSAYEAIREAGFSTIERVRLEDEANCIIRLFQKRHYKYGNNNPPIIFNLWGMSCFTKNSEGKWMSKRDLSGHDNNEFEIDFNKNFITNFLWHECITIDVDFFDIYVVIS